MSSDTSSETSRQQEASQLFEREVEARTFIAQHHGRREQKTKDFIQWAIVNGYEPGETLKGNFTQNIRNYFRRMDMPIPQKFWARFNDEEDLPAVRPPPRAGSSSGHKGNG